MKNNWNILDFGVFVGDVLNWVGLGYFGSGYLALGANC